VNWVCIIKIISSFLKDTKDVYGVKRIQLNVFGVEYKKTHTVTDATYISFGDTWYGNTVFRPYDP
jgi:hypothetical protein